MLSVLYDCVSFRKNYGIDSYLSLSLIKFRNDLLNVAIKNYIKKNEISAKLLRLVFTQFYYFFTSATHVNSEELVVQRLVKTVINAAVIAVNCNKGYCGLYQ